MHRVYANAAGLFAAGRMILKLQWYSCAFALQNPQQKKRRNPALCRRLRKSKEDKTR